MSAPKILVVDDVAENRRLLDAVLATQGYDVVEASGGEDALRRVAGDSPDLVLLDVMMPDLDGYDVCRKLREREQTAVLPIIMVTSSLASERTRAIEAGADDFIQKPFDSHELLTRVRSLLRIKRYHDELSSVNRTLEQRVERQVEELERLRRFERFLPPQLADALAASRDDSILRSHRRELSIVFCDLRGYTRFADEAEPEELMRVLGEFHEVVGKLVKHFGGTVGSLAGDGVQVFFNDPIEIDDAAIRAVSFACALRDDMAEVISRWRRRGYELHLGAGIALGYATCGEVGFEGRYDYAAIGSVTNLASRLCDEARGGQILIAPRLYAEIAEEVEVEAADDYVLKGFSRPVAACNVLAVKKPPAGLPLTAGI
jgi:adenylate cyclase